jgi:hypothetical protein
MVLPGQVFFCFRVPDLSRGKIPAIIPVYNGCPVRRAEFFSGTLPYRREFTAAWWYCGVCMLSLRLNGSRPGNLVVRGSVYRQSSADGNINPTAGEKP